MTLNIHADARAEIQKDVDRLHSSPRYFNLMVERAKTYFPIIERTFKEERVPDDLKYLVLQESALISNAVSSSNAVGYWQFKAETAKEMGLQINSQVDERMNIVAASRGAAKYFKHSNNYFNNWLHVVQSYQMGIGGTMRALGEEQHGSRHAEIMGDLGGQGGGHHRRDAGHRRIHPDHGGGDATLLKDDRQERQAKTDGDTDRTDGGNRSDQ